MILHTASGSVYELDEAERRIRRLSGASGGTPRQGSDGEWRNYLECGRYDGSLLIVWRQRSDGILESTLTSRIVRLEEGFAA